MVDVAIHIDEELRVTERHCGHVHSDGTIARGGGENRDATLVGGAEHGGVFDAEFTFALTDVFSHEKVEFIAPHGPLKLGPLDDFAHESIGVEQDIVIKEDIVDTDDSFVTEFDVIEEWGAGVKFHAQAEMEVMIEVCARGDDPVHEPCLHQGDDGGAAEASGGQSAGE